MLIVYAFWIFWVGLNLEKFFLTILNYLNFQNKKIQFFIAYSTEKFVSNVLDMFEFQQK